MLIALKLRLSIAKGTNTHFNNYFIPTKPNRFPSNYITSCLSQDSNPLCWKATTTLFSNVYLQFVNSNEDYFYISAYFPITLRSTHLLQKDKILINVLFQFPMISMQCFLLQLWMHVRRPIGIIIGMLSQFVLLPLSAFILIKVLGLGILHATGLLLLACSPGGVTSNIFTYFCDGDISLRYTNKSCI